MSQIDDITIFLPGCAGEEYEIRRRLRGFRNAASAMIASTECTAASQLAWMAAEYVTASLYSPAPVDDLAELAKFAKRLMLVAIQAEELHDRGLAA